MSLFQLATFKSHSGHDLTWKIECDFLTDEDWEAIADVIGQNTYFSAVYGVPQGGNKLAEKLKRYASDNISAPLLLVDDVLTTGASMEEAKSRFIYPPEVRIIGAVAFSRMKASAVPSWIQPVFQLGDWYVAS